MLRVRDLRKSFGPIRAVDGVSLDIPKGCFYGLLGPNGAGKTTTISMIVGTIEPDAGNVTIDGHPMAIRAPEAKGRIGYVPQELALFEEISARDNLRFIGSLYGLSGDRLARRMDQALELTGLTDRAREPVSRFSGGMKRRLNIAMALLHEPAILVLDEPTVGVDPQSRNAIFDSLRALQAQGTTLLYTTHYMEEVEKLCQRVAVMDRGKIVAEDTVANLQSGTTSKQSVIVNLVEPPGELTALIYSFTVETDTIRFELEDLSRDLPAVLKWLESNGIRYRGIQTDTASLETVFLRLTGSSLRD